MSRVGALTCSVPPALPPSTTLAWAPRIVATKATPGTFRAAFAAPFAEDGEAIGFDGSQHTGRAGIAADMQRIFADHPTAAYLAKVCRDAGATKVNQTYAWGISPNPESDTGQWDRVLCLGAAST